MIHSKATFIVSDIIIPIKRIVHISNISLTSLLSIRYRSLEVTHTSAKFLFPMAYNISHFLLFVYMTEMVFCRIFLENIVGGAVLGAPFFMKLFLYKNLWVAEDGDPYKIYM